MSISEQAPDIPPKAAPSFSRRNILVAARGGGIDFIGQIVALASQFIMGVVTARFLGAELFGLYRLALAFVNSQAAFTLLGLQTGVVRYVPIAQHERDEEQLWSVIQVSLIGPSLISLMLGLLTFFFADAIADQVFKNLALTPILRWLSFQIPLVTLSTMLTSVLQSFKKVQYGAYAGVMTPRMTKLVLATVLLTTGFGVMGVVAAQLVASTVSVLFLFYLLHTVFPLNRLLRVRKPQLGDLLRFSLPLYFSKLLRSLGGKFETLFLGFFGMTAGVGIFAAAAGLSSISNLFYGSLGTISAPIFAELHTKQEYDHLKGFYQSVTRWAVTFNLPFFIVSIFYGEPLLSIFGQEFRAGALSLVILASGSLFNAATGQCGPLINMIGKSKVSLTNSFSYLAATIIFDFLLIPRWGVEGAAWAASLTLIFMNLLRTIEIYYFLRILPFNRAILKPVAASGVATAAVYIVSEQLKQTHSIIQVALGIAVIGVVYGLMIVLFRFSPEDRLILDRLKKRLSISRLRRK